MSTSYANAAANGSSPETTSSVLTPATTSSPSLTPEIPDSAVNEPAEAAESTSPAAKPKKSLAPAPVPAKSVWGTSAPAQAPVDDPKWPTPDKVTETPASKAAKFIKPNKWVPISAKVVLPPTRTTQHASNGQSGANQQKNKRKNKNTRKKTPTAASPASSDEIIKKEDKPKDGDEATEPQYEGEEAPAAEQLHESAELHPQHQHQNYQHEGFRPRYNQNQTLPQGQRNRRYQNGTAPNGRVQPQQPRQQNGGYYQTFVPTPGYQNYNANRNQFRPLNGQYRSYSNGNLQNGNYNGYRPMGMPFVPIPHQPLPQGIMPGMPYPGALPVQIPPPISPKQDPLHALTQQIDYYFSLENLIRDVFLRRNMGTEGWIDLDLILNFKRVTIITNGIHNAIEETDEEKKAQELDLAILGAVQKCVNLEIGYLNGKDENTATATEVQLRVKDNFEQWLLPDN